LSEEEVAAVWSFAKDLTQREVAIQEVVIKEAQAPYGVLTGIAEEAICTDEEERQTTPQLATPDELLNFLAFGPPGFLPGELDLLMADVEHARDMELEALCQATC
jgi:hypothetical protein